MSFANPYARYRQTQVETASQIRMIVMLYDGVIRFLQQGVAFMKDGDAYQQCVHMNKALAVIDHLLSSVNLEEGGEIAKDLAHLFRYFHDRISFANANSDQATAQEVIGHLASLREAWATVEEMNRNPDQAVGDRREISVAA